MLVAERVESCLHISSRFSRLVQTKPPRNLANMSCHHVHVARGRSAAAMTTPPVNPISSWTAWARRGELCHGRCLFLRGARRWLAAACGGCDERVGRTGLIGTCVSLMEAQVPDATRNVILKAICVTFLGVIQFHCPAVRRPPRFWCSTEGWKEKASKIEPSEIDSLN
jgi:hypothetical protein